MSEQTAADALKASQVMISMPGEGHPQSGVFMQWGVCVGSHGGYGRTLAKAMRACLMCCGLGEWWHVDYGEGELLRDLFERVSTEHLGRPLYVAKAIAA